MNRQSVRKSFAAIPTVLALLAPIATAAAQAGQSTFGHARARELAELGRLPQSRDVVVRDIVNYHRHRLPLPEGGDALSLEVRRERQSIEPGSRFWLQVGYATTPAGDRSLAPPCAVALVVDCSGSMRERGKITQVHRGLEAFVQRLRPDDQVALIAFADEGRVVSPLRRRGDGRWLQAAVDQLQPGGSTNLHDGLALGVQQLEHGDLGKLTRRVVLLTDGIANQGVTDANEIAALASHRCGDAIDLSTIGVGSNLDTSLLQRLADANRGLFHFVADERDVQKVFVAEADSLLVPAARDVVLTVTLPTTRDLEIPGHDFTTRNGTTVTVRLKDCNAGATGVVMMHCRMPLSGSSAQPYEVPASLWFHRATDGKRRNVIGGTTLTCDEGGNGQPDPIVRKNAAIAVLAQGLKNMSVATERRRWATADRELRLARDEARRLFPGEDADVQRVRDIAKGHARTLRRYVDRFRDI